MNRIIKQYFSSEKMKTVKIHMKKCVLLNIAHNQWNSSLNHRILPHMCQNGYHPKQLK